MPAVYEFGIDPDRPAKEIDPATVGLARRVQQAAREIDGRDLDDDTAIAYAKVIDGTW